MKSLNVASLLQSSDRREPPLCLCATLSPQRLKVFYSSQTFKKKFRISTDDDALHLEMQLNYIITLAMAEWVQVSTSTQNTNFFVDIDTVKYSGKYVAFWIKTIPSDGKIIHSLQITNCFTGNWLEQQQITYAPTGQVLKHTKYKPNKIVVEQLIPGSSAEEIYDFVCW